MTNIDGRDEPLSCHARENHVSVVGWSSGCVTEDLEASQVSRLERQKSSSKDVNALQRQE
eukprot:337737-Hanusia_phi.AAC.2